MTDEDELLAIMGSTARAQTMADSSLRLTIDISPKDMQTAFTMFGTPGTAVALAVIKNEVAVEHDRPKADLKTEYGEYARSLKLSDFFRTPAVWKAVGKDAWYLEWVKRQPSALSGEYSEFHDDGGEYCIPAHVRRIEHGSGTAIKPPYSAIPLTKMEHDKAHQEGDSAIGTEEWWQKERINYVSTWCWVELKATLDWESWADMPPLVLVDWCSENGLLNYLPSVYRSYISAESEAGGES